MNSIYYFLTEFIVFTTSSSSLLQLSCLVLALMLLAKTLSCVIEVAVVFCPWLVGNDELVLGVDSVFFSEIISFEALDFDFTFKFSFSESNCFINSTASLSVAACLLFN